MKFKKIFAGLVTGVMVVGLIGCGSTSEKLQKKLKANLEIVELRDYEDGTIKDEFTKEEYDKVRKQCDAANAPDFLELIAEYGPENGQRMIDALTKRVQSTEYEIITKSEDSDKIVFTIKSQAMDGGELEKIIDSKFDKYSDDGNFENKKLEEIQKELADMIVKAYEEAPTKETENDITYTKKDGQWNPDPNFANITEKIYTAD